MWWEWALLQKEAVQWATGVGGMAGWPIHWVLGHPEGAGSIFWTLSTSRGVVGPRDLSLGVFPMGWTFGLGAQLMGDL